MRGYILVRVHAGHTKNPDSLLGIGVRETSHPHGGWGKKNCGSVLLSQHIVALVPSTLAGLTSEFGMGSGVAPPVWPPQNKTAIRIKRYNSV